MNICFISNFSKTILLTSVAKSLRKKGIKVYWIACNQKRYHQLCEDFGTTQVLLINRSNIGKANNIVGDFKINELVFGDRVLRHDFKSGVEFLKNIQRPIFGFLSENKIEKVYGEVTWAHELLIHRMCSQMKSLNCQFLNPHVVRIPNQRFAFFTDEKQSQLLEQNKLWDSNTKTIVPKPPNYLKINHKILRRASSWKGKFSRIKRFFTNENMDHLDPTLIANSKIRIKISAKEEWRRWQYKNVKTIKDLELKNLNYLFLGLHKQPEASVDVLGRYYEDQYQNIINLWRALPEGWSFVIKEHSIAIGDRALAFYKKIQALPGIILVNEQMPSYELIKHAQLVATVSGTIAYEAALMGIPAITFAPCFFNRLNCCTNVGLEDLDKNNLVQIANSLSQNPNNVKSFSKYLYTNSFIGNVLDPISDPNVLNEENIELLTNAFLQTLISVEINIAVL